MDSFIKGSSRNLYLFQLLVGEQGAGSLVQDCNKLKLASEAFFLQNSTVLGSELCTTSILASFLKVRKR
jgi:hypothetical protein